MGDAVINSAAGRALPAELNAFVGRGELVEEVVGRLRARRAVTLLGPAGIGKTRLSRRVATIVADAIQDVVLVDLTDQSSWDEVLSAVAEAIGIPDNAPETPLSARLIDYLRHRQLLLVLDNCERLTEPVARLAQTLLQAAAGLRILATSRRKIGMPGEYQIQVGPLNLGESLTLLHERGAAVNPDWTPGDRNALSPADHAAAMDLCQMVEGIPLSIELAAGRLDVMTVHEIVESLCAPQTDDRQPRRVGVAAARRLGLLQGGEQFEQRHHRSLETTLDISYNLLTSPAQRVLSLVWVFAGGFDLQAAQAVCMAFGIPAEETQGLLSALVQHSLVHREVHQEATWYRMLETIREYGAQHVTDEEVLRLEHAHADYIVGMVDAATLNWFSPDELAWIRRLQAHNLNIRAALEFLLADPEQVPRGQLLALGAVRTRYQIFRGTLNEARRYLRDALDAQPDPDQPSPLQAMALSMGAYLAFAQGEPARGAPILTEARAIVARLGIDEQEFAPLLFAMGTQMWLAEPDTTTAATASQLFYRAADLSRAVGFEGDYIMGRLFGSAAEAFTGTPETALADSAALLAEAQAVGAPWLVSWALWVRAVAETLHGDPQLATISVQQSLRMQYEMGESWGQGWGLLVRAWLAISQGDFTRAGQVFGGALERLEFTRSNLGGLLTFLRIHERFQHRARRELGDEEWDIQVALGRGRPYDELLAIAVEAVTEPAREDAQPNPFGLTRREAEVAALVAKGMTNREIALDLGMSERTAEKHVSNIMAKLKVDRRVQLATIMTSRPST